MSAGACENCGSTLAVAPVTYTDDGQRLVRLLCEECKETLLARRRTRSRHAHRRRSTIGARLSRIVGQGGPLAYIGVGLFVLGVVLVPALIIISLLTR